MPSIPILAILLIFIGILGYSLSPPRNYSSGLAAIVSIHITYVSFGFFVFFDICDFQLVKELVAIAMGCIAIVGTYFVSRVWEFESKRFRDAVLYVSVVYIVCQDVKLPIGRSVEYLTAFVAFLIIFLSAYMVYNFKRHRIEPIVERPELFMVQFMVVAFTGVYCATGSPISVLVALALSVYALQALIHTGFREKKGLY